MRTVDAFVARCAVATSLSVTASLPTALFQGTFVLAFDLALDPSGRVALAGSPPCDVSLWMSGMGTTPGFRWSSSACGSNGGVRAALMTIEGGAAVVYATGCFESVLDVPAGSVVRWDGLAWSTVGAPPVGSGAAIIEWGPVKAEDGEVTTLVVAGSFGTPPQPSVHAFDGLSWTQLGGAFDPPSRALARIEHAGGTAIVAGGDFATVDGLPRARVALWNGTQWMDVGGGTSGPVHALLTSDVDGDGAVELVAAGAFTTAGGSPANRIAAWNGESWSPLSTGMNGTVRALSMFDAGDGPRLWAGGSFTSAGGVDAKFIARWDGGGWSAPIAGLSSEVRALAASIMEGQPTLLISRGQVHRFRAGVLSQLGQLTQGPVGQYARVVAAAPSAPDLVIALGAFLFADQTYAPGVAQWDGGRWRSMPDHLPGFSTDASVLDLLVRQEIGGEEALILAGDFERAGGVPAASVARWTRRGFEAIGGSSPWQPYGFAIRLLAEKADAPSELLLGGQFDPPSGDDLVGIARFDGLSWAPWAVIEGDQAPGPFVHAMCVFDDGSGPALHVGGFFDAIGGVAARNIARFDGSVWAPLGVGVDGPVRALEVFDDGTGPALHVGGEFAEAGGVFTAGLARWDGKAWSAMGPPPSMDAQTSGSVWDFEVFDDGDGPRLHVGGFLGDVDSWPGQGVHRWNGSSWEQVGASIAGGVRRLHTWSDGVSTRLVAAGDFQVLSQPSIADIAAWDGRQWTALGNGGVSLPGSSAATWWCLAPLADGRLVGGGYFSALGQGGPAPFLSVFGPWWTPFVIASPHDRVVRAGEKIVLVAQVAVSPSGSDMTFAWLRDGTPLVDGEGVKGASTLVLTIEAADAADAGIYSLVAVAACGEAVTVPAMIAVTCASDATLDGTVDGADLGVLLAHWGADVGGESAGDGDVVCGLDLDGDGLIGAGDVAVLLAEWGGCPGW